MFGTWKKNPHSFVGLSSIDRKVFNNKFKNSPQKNQLKLSWLCPVGCLS